jgi:hypothetical protein
MQAAVLDFFSFLDRPQLFLYCVLAGIPFYISIARFMFGGWRDFLDSLGYIFQPDWLSALRGEWQADYWESFKVYFYILLCAGMAATMYQVALRIF